MKKRIIIVKITLLVLLFTAGLWLLLDKTLTDSEPIEVPGTQTNTINETLTDVNPAQMIPHKIVFIYQYTNYAWGYYNSGFIIDNEGNVKPFSIGEDESLTEDDLDNLKGINGKDWKAYENKYFENLTEVIGTVDIDKLKLNYARLLEVDPENMSESKLMAFDAGVGTYTGFIYKDGKYVEIPLGTVGTGDLEYHTTDFYGKKIYRWLEEVHSLRKQSNINTTQNTQK